LAVAIFDWNTGTHVIVLRLSSLFFWKKPWKSDWSNLSRRG